MNNCPYEHLEAMGKRLASVDEFWEYWGFEPWDSPPFSGVVRRQRFVKEGILGPIAEYQALDYIAWAAGSEEDREILWQTVRPMENVMTQRFLFIVEAPWTNRRIKSFFAGLKGYVEFYAYRPTDGGGLGTTHVADLTELVHMGLRLGMAGTATPR
jgi:hypothetical protein